MIKLTASGLNKSDVQSVIVLDELGVDDYPWLQTDHVTLTDAERQRLSYLQGDFIHCQVQLLNESTVWAI